MAAHQVRPEQEDAARRAAQEQRLRDAWRPPRGWFFRWTDVNNNQVGTWYAATAWLLMLFAGGVRPHKSASVGYKSTSSAGAPQALPFDFIPDAEMIIGTRAEGSNRLCFCQQPCSPSK